MKVAKRTIGNENRASVGNETGTGGYDIDRIYSYGYQKASKTGEQIGVLTDSQVIEEKPGSSKINEKTIDILLGLLERSESSKQVSSTKEGGDQPLDEGYNKMIDRLDQDMRDHKQEIRDRDARLQTEFKEREIRIHNEAKEREERIISSIAELKEESKTTKNVVIGLAISVIVGIAAMVLAVVLAK